MFGVALLLFIPPTHHNNLTLAFLNPVVFVWAGNAQEDLAEKLSHLRNDPSALAIEEEQLCRVRAKVALDTQVKSLLQIWMHCGALQKSEPPPVCTS